MALAHPDLDMWKWLAERNVFRMGMATDLIIEVLGGSQRPPLNLIEWLFLESGQIEPNEDVGSALLWTGYGSIFRALVPAKIKKVAPTVRSAWGEHILVISNPELFELVFYAMQNGALLLSDFAVEDLLEFLSMDNFRRIMAAGLNTWPAASKLRPTVTPGTSFSFGLLQASEISITSNAFYFLYSLFY